MWERHIQIPPHEECEVLLGLGMRTQADGRTMLLGSLELLRAEKVRISAKAKDWVHRLRIDAETPLLLAVDHKLVGLVSLRDTVRPEARQVIDALRADGVTRIVMLTGDHPETAAVIAAELGIDEWRAETLPEDKQDVIRALKADGHTVAMVGDGTNDAPALALADIGIADTDVAVETADFALAGDDLRRVLDLRDLAGRSIGLIQQNYGMSIAVNALGLSPSALAARSPRSWPPSCTTCPPSPSAGTAPGSPAIGLQEAQGLSTIHSGCRCKWRPSDPGGPQPSDQR